MNTNPFDDALIRNGLAANRRVHDVMRMLGAEPRADHRRARLLKQYSLPRAIFNLVHERRDGLEGEFHEDCARSQLPLQANSILVPYEVCQRADTVFPAADGGYLVETLNLPVADALRPNTVTAALGANVIPLPSGANISLPKQSGTATAYWLTTESTPIPETDATFGQVSFMPRTIGVYSELSRLLNLQAPAVQDTVTRDHARLVGRAIDLAALYGTGINGQPQGLANASGVQTFSAASLSISALVNAQVALGNGLTQSAGVAATLANAGTMRERTEFSSGDKTLWTGPLTAGTCGGLPARSSTALTPNQLILGSWEFLNIVLWGAMEISVNPFDRGNFQSGVVGLRTFMTLDVGATFPAAFSIGSNFS
jgi:HK97 family phage major capsid protein